MSRLIDFLTYQSDTQRYGSVFGGAMLGLSALVVFVCMVRIRRKPRLDQALTVKQLALFFFGIRLVIGNLLQRPSELWGTLIICSLGVASIGVMVETLRSRRVPDGGWIDPYAVIVDRDHEIDGLRTMIDELHRRLGMAVEVE